MIDINKEAYELYPENWESIMDGRHDSNSYERQAFIAGHNSKATQAKVLQAQIDVYSDLLRQSENHKAAICKYMIKQVETLQQQLKELKNEFKI
jgi:hypothetical protein